MSAKWWRRAPLVLAAVLVAVLATLAIVLSGPRETAAPPVSAERTAVEPSAEPETSAGMPKADPVSIDVPKIEAKSSLIPLGLNADNTIEVPPITQPMQAGWYVHGPTPGRSGRR